jgi:hypothetical protein
LTALIPIYIHLFGFTLPNAFRCLLYTPSSGASTRFIGISAVIIGILLDINNDAQSGKHKKKYLVVIVTK